VKLASSVCSGVLGCLLAAATLGGAGARGRRRHGGAFMPGGHTPRACGAAVMPHRTSGCRRSFGLGAHYSGGAADMEGRRRIRYGADARNWRYGPALRSILRVSWRGGGFHGYCGAY